MKITPPPYPFGCIPVCVCVYLPVSVWYEQREKQEVGGALVLAGVEEQFQH